MNPLTLRSWLKRQKHKIKANVFFFSIFQIQLKTGFAQMFSKINLKFIGFHQTCATWNDTKGE